MKQEVKDVWVAALRSGEFTRTEGRLKKVFDGEARHCCLGVLCELHAQATGEEWLISGEYKEESYLGRNGSLPQEVVAWAELKDSDPEVRVDDGIFALSKLNDAGHTEEYEPYNFDQIADAIEESL